MARVAFKLRRVDPLFGSYLKYDESIHGARDDADSGLRANSLQIAPTVVVTSPFLSATSTCYGEVDLEWAVPIVPLYIGGDENPDITDAEVAPTSVILVYSPDGPPETIGSGDVVVESDSTFSVRHPINSSDSLPEGKWAYYSLFLRYQSRDGDDYYERVAFIQELVPENLGSTLELWARIPAYYRSLDESIGTPLTDSDRKCLGFDNYGSNVGPLLRFLSIFGFEMDRLRTTLNYIAVSKDPSVADLDSLDALSLETGVPLDARTLGAIRLRTLLDDIGTFRRIKGTAEGAEFFVRALSGSEAIVDSAAREIKVYAQRVNHIRDPKGTATVVDYLASKSAEVGEGPFDILYAATRSPLDADRTIHRNTSTLTAGPGDVITFSVHSGTGGYIQWARVYDEDEDAIVAASSTPVYREGVPYFDIIMPPSLAPGTTVSVEWMVDDTQGTFVAERMLLEKNSIGAYFDGDEVRGGWLVDTGSISDYRWEGGVRNNARSLYNDDYSRTQQVIDQLLEYVLPIDVADQFTASFNNIA